MTKQQFTKLVEMVIDNLEGGYYHPDMLKDGRIKDTRYSKSGETMFGIDRVAGGDINKTKAGLEFWKLIDNANARSNWQWNYKGGDLAPKLKRLVADMIYPLYEKYSKLYLTDKSRKIIDRSNALTFHFVYSVWNGAGWFKRFAESFNSEVEKGITNKNILFALAIEHRIATGNSLIIQGAKKISKIKFMENKKIIVFAGISILLLGITGILIYKINK